MANRLEATIIALFLPILAFAQVSRVEMPTVTINEEEVPECVHLGRTSLHFPGGHDAFDGLYATIADMLSSGEGNVNIWHVGGSHVQGSYFPDRIRNDFATVSRGEFGFAVPFRMIHSAYDKEQFFTVTGEWDPSMASRSYKGERPKYGITGFGARTSDPEASVAFNLLAKGDSLRSTNAVRVLGYSPDGKSFPFIVNGSDTLRSTLSGNGQYYIDIQQDLDSVRVDFDIPKGSSFILNGLEPVSGNSGFNYYASGVNGASLPTWLDKCSNLRRDMPLAKPDIAIFGLGINDSACKQVDFKVDVFKERYRKLMALIRETSPDCRFIFITNNDSYRYLGRGMTYNYNGPAVEKAMFELAEECGGAVWDLYDIMGGKDSVTIWREEGLVQKDRLHFTQTGYELLADLFYNAFAEDYNNCTR